MIKQGNTFRPRNSLIDYKTEQMGLSDPFKTLRTAYKPPLPEFIQTKDKFREKKLKNNLT